MHLLLIQTELILSLLLQHVCFILSSFFPPPCTCLWSFSLSSSTCLCGFVTSTLHSHWAAFVHISTSAAFGRNVLINCDLLLLLIQKTMNTEHQRQTERWRRDVAERNTSSRPVARSNTRHTTHCQSSWWLWKKAPLPLRLVLLAAAVHHFCPALLLLLKKFVQGAVLLGVRKLSEYCEKLFWKLVWSSYLGWLGMQFGGNIVIIIISFIHRVLFKVLKDN